MTATAKKIAKPTKDTVYIDIEDEITAVIDKLKRSDAKVVALVLPKRATTMQSVVNLKLLKRAAESVKKNIVLITSDSSVMPLAGVVGLHVAKTLQSKPSVPVVPKIDEESITIDSEIDGVDASPDPELDPEAPIGKLAGEETIDVEENAIVTDTKQPKKKNKKLAVPNFDKFRTKLILGAVAVVLLVVGWFFGSVVLPKATITIKTDTSQVNASLALDAKSDVKEADLEKSIVPAYKKELKKSSVEKVPTTGKRDDGTKATGTMTLTNCIKDDNQYTIPAGTSFSASGLNYVTTAPVTLAIATYQGSTCKSATSGDSKQVAVSAESGGSKYNLSSRSYSTPGAYVTSNGSILASGSDMAGGTSKLVSIVSQSDLDGAKQQALDKLSQASTAELKTLFKTDQAIGLDGSLENQTPVLTSTPEVGKEASEVEVTVNVTYAMHGIKRDILTKAIEKEVGKKIDTKKQAVQNTGLDQADIRVTDKPSPTFFKVSIQTTATAGPQLDADGIKKDIAGKKRGQTNEIISTRPGITDVKISYSPFWVVSTPKKTSRITVNFIGADATKK